MSIKIIVLFLIYSHAILGQNSSFDFYCISDFNTLYMGNP